MPGGCTTAVDRILVVIRQVIQVLSKHPCAGAMATRNPASRVFSAVRIAARLHRPHAVLYDLLHASQRLMNLGAIGDLPGGEFVPAQPTDKIGTELQLPEPDAGTWDRPDRCVCSRRPRTSCALRFGFISSP